MDTDVLVSDNSSSFAAWSSWASCRMVNTNVGFQIYTIMLLVLSIFLFLFVVVHKQVDKKNSHSHGSSAALYASQETPTRKHNDELPNNGLVSSEIKQCEQRYAHILSELIRCKSISYDKPTISVGVKNSKIDKSHKALKALHTILQNNFPILHEKFAPTILGGHSLLYSINGIDETLKPILFCSHLDVVSAVSGAENDNHDEDEGDKAWEFDPFGGEIVDGYVRGRGAIDNKHNVVGQVAAMENFLSKNLTLTRGVYIAIGHDEEIGGYDGASTIAQYLLDRKGPNFFEFILDEGTMIVSGAVPCLDRPLAMIGTVEKGYMNVEISVSGPGGHASIPSINNDNILCILSKSILALEHNPMPSHFEAGSPFRITLEYIANHLRFPMNVVCKNLWAFGFIIEWILLKISNGAAASVRTTTTVTKIRGGNKCNVIPFKAKAYVNHRVHPADSLDSVLEHDRRTINDDRVKLRIMDGSTYPSPVSVHNSNGFHAIQHCVKSVFGHPSAPVLLMGNTDTRWYWKLSPCIYRFSPVVLTMKETSMIHGLNERIGTKALMNVVYFYETLIVFCNGEI